MNPEFPFRLTSGQASDLVAGALPGGSLALFRRVVLSKHKIFLEVARRRADGSALADVQAALDLLDDVHRARPDIVNEVVGLPHVGGWFVDNLSPVGGSAPANMDTGYLSALAAVAALKSDVAFDLRVRPHGDVVVLPGHGMLAPPRGVTEIRLISAPQARAVADDWSCAIPEGSQFFLLPRLEVEADGLALRVTLDSWDSYLARYNAPTQRPRTGAFDLWRDRLGDAWRVLVTTDRSRAEALVTLLHTIVPLRGNADGSPSSATSGWTPGAMALSLPKDGFTLAETLVHEIQHALLGLVEDIVPLVDPAADVLCYAPWRSDPRPPAGLLHGCFAHAAVVDFWRRRRPLSSLAERPRAELAFARWRQATHEAVSTLLASGALTTAGRNLATAMSEALSSSLEEPVPTDVRRRANDINADHRKTWEIVNAERLRMRLGTG